MINPVAIALSKHHEELTVEEWLMLENAGIVNGCGGKGQWLLIWILKKVCKFWIQASCRIHDFGYAQGGIEQRRLYCDTRFLQVMLDDGFIKITNKVYYLYYTLLCLIAFYLIRRSGSQFFNYR